MAQPPSAVLVPVPVPVPVPYQEEDPNNDCQAFPIEVGPQPGVGLHVHVPLQDGDGDGNEQQQQQQQQFGYEEDQGNEDDEDDDTSGSLSSCSNSNSNSSSNSNSGPMRLGLVRGVYDPITGTICTTHQTGQQQEHEQQEQQPQDGRHRHFHHQYQDSYTSSPAASGASSCSVESGGFGDSDSDGDDRSATNNTNTNTTRSRSISHASEAVQIPPTLQHLLQGDAGERARIRPPTGSSSSLFSASPSTIHYCADDDDDDIQNGNGNTDPLSLNHYPHHPPNESQYHPRRQQSHTPPRINTEITFDPQQRLQSPPGAHYLGNGLNNKNNKNNLNNKNRCSHSNTTNSVDGSFCTALADPTGTPPTFKYFRHHNQHKHTQQTTAETDNADSTDPNVDTNACPGVLAKVLFPNRQQEETSTRIKRGSGNLTVAEAMDVEQHQHQHQHQYKKAHVKDDTNHYEPLGPAPIHNLLDELSSPNTNITKNNSTVFLSSSSSSTSSSSSSQENDGQTPPKTGLVKQKHGKATSTPNQKPQHCTPVTAATTITMTASTLRTTTTTTNSATSSCPGRYDDDDDHHHDIHMDDAEEYLLWCDKYHSADDTFRWDDFQRSKNKYSNRLATQEKKQIFQSTAKVATKSTATTSNTNTNTAPADTTLKMSMDHTKNATTTSTSTTAGTAAQDKNQKLKKEDTSDKNDDGVVLLQEQLDRALETIHHKEQVAQQLARDLVMSRRLVRQEHERVEQLARELQTERQRQDEKEWLMKNLVQATAQAQTPMRNLFASSSPSTISKLQEKRQQLKEKNQKEQREPFETKSQPKSLFLRRRRHTPPPHPQSSLQHVDELYHPTMAANRKNRRRRQWWYLLFQTWAVVFLWMTACLVVTSSAMFFFRRYQQQQPHQQQRQTQDSQPRFSAFEALLQHKESLWSTLAAATTSFSSKDFYKSTHYDAPQVALPSTLDWLSHQDTGRHATATAAETEEEEGTERQSSSSFLAIVDIYTTSTRMMKNTLNAILDRFSILVQQQDNNGRLAEMDVLLAEHIQRPILLSSEYPKKSPQLLALEWLAYHDPLQISPCIFDDDDHDDNNTTDHDGTATSKHNKYRRGVTETEHIRSTSLTTTVASTSSCLDGGYSGTGTGTEASLEMILERFVLGVFYFAAGGPDWKKSKRWMSGRSVCHWESITCNRDGYVSRIDLHSKGLSGTIPREIGHLSRLISLDLGENRNLKGTLPTEFGKLTNLQHLSLWSNALEGRLPIHLGDLTQLKVLDLDGNHLSGTLPTQFGNLSHLQILKLGSNNLSGSLPRQLVNLVRLRKLFLGCNQFSGSVPIELGQLRSIERLILDGGIIL